MVWGKVVLTALKQCQRSLGHDLAAALSGIRLLLDLRASPSSSLDRSGGIVAVRTSLLDQLGDPVSAEVVHEFTIGEGVCKIAGGTQVSYNIIKLRGTLGLLPNNAHSRAKKALARTRVLCNDGQCSKDGFYVWRQCLGFTLLHRKNGARPSIHSPFA